MYNDYIKNFRAAVSKGRSHEAAADGYSEKSLCLPLGKEIDVFAMKSNPFRIAFFAFYHGT
ncbi:MAG: hypothetical protein K0R84_977 [Clostridia bacterium]|jgi:hypothetical protein|nr:hypothetical protein [Clostridia bacterium]